MMNQLLIWFYLKKLTPFQKLVGLCDYIYDYEILHRTTKSIRGFLVFLVFFETTSRKIAKVSHFRGIL